jgi:DNA-binding transcriptional MerR regulator
MNDTPDVLDLEGLCRRSGLTRRTVRFYIQMGLVDHPVGTTRGAHYTAKHLEQLLTIRQLRDAGMSLDGIGRRLNPQPAVPPAAAVSASAGVPEIWRRVKLCDGVELHFRDSGSLSPAQAELLEAGRSAGSPAELAEALMRILPSLCEKERFS